MSDDNDGTADGSSSGVVGWLIDWWWWSWWLWTWYTSGNTNELEFFICVNAQQKSGQGQLLRIGSKKRCWVPHWVTAVIFFCMQYAMTVFAWIVQYCRRDLQPSCLFCSIVFCWLTQFYCLVCISFCSLSVVFVFSLFSFCFLVSLVTPENEESSSYNAVIQV